MLPVLMLVVKRGTEWEFKALCEDTELVLLPHLFLPAKKSIGLTHYQDHNARLRVASRDLQVVFELMFVLEGRETLLCQHDCQAQLMYESESQHKSVLRTFLFRPKTRTLIWDECQYRSRNAILREAWLCNDNFKATVNKAF